MDGNSTKAAEMFARALERAPEYSTRRNLVAQMDKLRTDLSALLELRPDDPLLWASLANRQAGDRNHEAAAQSLARARSLTEALLAQSPADEALAAFLADLLLTDTTAWTVLQPMHIDSENGEQFTVEVDGSIFVSGPNPARAVYTIQSASPVSHVACLRIETLPDPRLPHSGAGRYPENGNFHLSEVTLAIAPTVSGGDATPNQIAGIAADESTGYAPTNMIDGNPGTRWEVYPRHTERQAVLIALKTPVRFEQGNLKIMLDSGTSKWGQSGLGRFRLSVTDEPGVLDKERQCRAALKLTNPWLKLGAAYAVVGDVQRSNQLFASALDREFDFSRKRQLIGQIEESGANLAGLIEVRPDDPVLLIALAKQQAARGAMAGAAEAFARVLRLLKEQLAATPDGEHVAGLLADLLLANGEASADWTPLEPVEMTSAAGATLERQSDGSILLSGVNADVDSYTLTARLNVGAVAGLRLEVLPDKSLPGGGSSRSTTGASILLTGFQVELQSAGQRVQPVIRAPLGTRAA